MVGVTSLRANTDCMMEYTIYLIENEVNGKGYVGMTCQPLTQRLHQHLSAARNGVKASLCHAIRKYGEDNFSISPIDEAETEEEAAELEQEWISRLDTYEGPEYNETPGGQIGNDNAGRDRETKGEKHHHSPFSAEQVRSMRREFGNGKATYESLATRHSVDKSAIGRIIRGETWTHVDIPPELETKIEQRIEANRESGLAHREKLSDEEVCNIRQSVRQSEATYAELAEKYEMSKTYIGRVVRGDYRPDVGRGSVEEQHRPSCGASKLTEPEVLEIRRRYEQENLSYSDLGAEYGVTGGTIGPIIRRETWTHI